MSLPGLNDEGLLPPGVHDANLDELGARFGAFQGSDQRPTLYNRFREFVGDATACGLFVEVIVDGSFVTFKARPNDIDVVLVLHASHDFDAPLSPRAYNLLSKKRARRMYGFDVFAAADGSGAEREWIAFFAQVRDRPGLEKGLVRIRL